MVSRHVLGLKNKQVSLLSTVLSQTRAHAALAVIVRINPYVDLCHSRYA